MIHQLFLQLLAGAVVVCGFQSPQATAVPGGAAPELLIIPVDRGTTRIEEKGVLQSGIVAAGGRGGQPTGVKVYKFDLKPRETLEVKMTAELHALVLQFLQPAQANKMTRAIHAANQPPKPFRAGRIIIKNPTDEAQEAVLSVSGPVNHAFSLTITYKPGK